MKIYRIIKKFMRLEIKRPDLNFGYIGVFFVCLFFYTLFFLINEKDKMALGSIYLPAM